MYARDVPNMQPEKKQLAENKIRDNSFSSNFRGKAGSNIKKGISKTYDAESTQEALNEVAELRSELEQLKAKYKALEKQVELQDQIIANYGDGFFIIDEEGKMLVVNEALCLITGYSREELINIKPPYPYWPPEEYETIGAAVKQKYGKKENKFNLTFRRKNEERFPAVIQTFNIEDAQGKITHCFATIKDLSTIENAYKSIRESKQKYEDLFERTSDAVYKSTPDGRVISANPALVKMLGFESEEALKKVQIKEELYFHPSEREAVLSENLEVYRLKKKDGTEIWVEDQGYFHYDENGKILLHQGILRDVTDRKRVEDNLKTSENKLRSNIELLQSILDSPKGIIIFSLDTKYCYKAFTNSHKETMKNIWGVDIEIGENMLDFISNKDDRKKAKANFDRTLKGEELLFLEDYGDETLTRSFWENRYSPIYAQDGSITGLTVFVTDVSTRMRDQERLEKSEKALRDAQKLSKTGSWEMELHSGELTWSEELYRIFELEKTEDEALYQAFLERIYKDDLPLVNEKIRQLIEKGESFVIEHRIYSSGDDLKYVLCKGEPILNEQNEIISIRGVMLDISEKIAREKIIQQNLQTLNEQNIELHRLVESNVRLENFAYIASHDLRSPVRTINSFTGLLKSRAGDKLDAEEHKFLEFIGSGAREIQGLIEDMLAYSKVKSKGFNPANLEVKYLLENLLTTLSADIHEFNATVIVKDVPSQVWGDRIKLWQVFQNLIMNAMKFHIKGSAPEVVVSGETREEEWIFQIRDNGIGIDPEFHEKIFGLFRQLNTKEAFEGTGLGLAICKKIIEQHKGRIWVASDPGKGATFYFSLPKPSEHDESLGID